KREPSQEQEKENRTSGCCDATLDHGSLPVIDLNKPMGPAAGGHGRGERGSIEGNNPEAAELGTTEPSLAPLVTEDQFSIKPEFWIERELAKVEDPKRRSFLAKKFEGVEGYQKFLTLMKTRKGAVEFKTGVWLSKLPKYPQKDLDKLKRPCAVCGDPLM